MSYFSHGMRWLTLLVSLPPTPSRHRVGVWRKLKRLGALSLRGAAWILPETPETTERLQWLAQEIRTLGGEATLLHVDRVGTMSDAEVAGLFHTARAADYEPVARACREVQAGLDRLRAGGRGAVEPLRARLAAAQRDLERVHAVDHLDSPAGRRTRAIWERVAARVSAQEARPRAGGRR
ncbi:MAG TPA: Chromate resistance protein ChrB, partial [Methylomirabilota bacterium]|nr:Chromate resistance protein ChrB [Methylomirabilota bacterium]